MNLQFQSDEDQGERAVSPVIGVILMVAITVILAAVIAAFVMDIGDLDDSTPQAQLDFEEVSDGTDDYVIISHNGGDDIDLGNVEVSGDVNSDGFVASGSGDPSSSASLVSSGELADEEFTSGNQLVVDRASGEGGIEAADQSITLVWDTGDGGSVIGEHETTEAV